MGDSKDSAEQRLQGGSAPIGCAGGGLAGNEATVLLALTCAALIVRTVMLARTVDVPGVGPVHAMFAYDRYRNPYFATFGNWLPGYTYLAGLCTLAIPNPLVAPRVLNLILGAFTVPLFYRLTRCVYGGLVAILSALALLFLPLHISLSVSSLTEASFLFFVVAALLCLVLSLSRNETHFVFLALFAICFNAATMTRYEAWPLIPLIACYLYARSRNVGVTLVASAASMAFAVFWSIGNYRHFGDSLYGMHRSIRPLEVGNQVSLTAAIADVLHQSRHHLCWLVVIAATAGLILELARSIRRHNTIDRIAYVVLVVTIWSMIIFIARSVGPALYSRYLLIACAITLPFAVISYLEIFGRSFYASAAGALIILISSTMVYRGDRDTCATRTMPVEMIAVARWLPASRYHNDAILITKMD